MPDRPAEVRFESLIAAVDREHDAHAIAARVNKLRLRALTRKAAVILNCDLLVKVHSAAENNMIPTFITPRRAWIAAGILCVLFALGGAYSWRINSLEKRITAQQLVVAASEAEAAGHRVRELELEKAMTARDVVIAAKDVLIEANSKQKAELNQQVAAEQLQFQSELAAGADLTADQLHDRICARFAAAGIKSESYCGK